MKIEPKSRGRLYLEYKYGSIERAQAAFFATDDLSFLHKMPHLVSRMVGRELETEKDVRKAVLYMKMLRALDLQEIFQAKAPNHADRLCRGA